ncbi:MAG: hypothetical protein IIA45_14810 [Bacteroidetes bacterium]|nr:hypothetical protein [Bacteroidota bacterium]
MTKLLNNNTTNSNGNSERSPAKKGRKPNSEFTCIIIKDYRIKMNESSYVLYRNGNPRPLGNHSKIVHCVIDIIEDIIRRKKKPDMTLDEFIRDYKQLENEIMTVLD